MSGRDEQRSEMLPRDIITSKTSHRNAHISNRVEKDFNLTQREMLLNKSSAFSLLESYYVLSKQCNIRVISTYIIGITVEALNPQTDL